MTEEIIIAGFGGQGVMLIGRLLAHAGMTEGKSVSWIPAYGPEMRGGTANCSVVVSDEPIGSPVVAEPDALIAMNRPSLEKFVSSVKPDGVVIYNTSLIDLSIQRDDVRAIAVSATDIASELGSVRAANMVALGAYLKATDCVSMKAVVDTMKVVLPRLDPHSAAINIEALKRGADIAQD